MQDINSGLGPLHPVPVPGSRLAEEAQASQTADQPPAGNAIHEPETPASLVQSLPNFRELLEAALLPQQDTAATPPDQVLTGCQKLASSNQ